MHTDSLIPLLESDSREEDSCGSQGSVAKVFMAGTPVPESSLRGGAPVEPSVVVGNVVAGDRRQLTREEREAAADKLLNTQSQGIHWPTMP